MRWRKSLLSLFLAFAVVISTVSLGWSIAHNDYVDTKIYSLHLFFALYIFVISARSVMTDNHSNSILHLTVLLTVAVLLLGSAAILPDGSPPVAASTDDEPVLLGLWYALLSIYTVACLLAYSTPLGPPLHYPPSDIYFEKIVKSITNVDERNVCGSTGKRPLDVESFCFNHIFRRLSLGLAIILIRHESGLAWKYRGKPRYRGSAHSSFEDACHLQLCTHEESSAHTQA